MARPTSPGYRLCRRLALMVLALNIAVAAVSITRLGHPATARVAWEGLGLSVPLAVCCCGFLHSLRRRYR